jgi:dTDP-4-dehydrorhamnose reductase
MPYRETDPPAPLSVYGRSKQAGEQAVLDAGGRCLVIRTCGLYGRAPTRGKGNFVQTMLRLGRERPEVRVVDDQVCTPTHAGDLADAILGLLATEESGLYHGTNSGSCSWYAFAAEIFRRADLPAKLVPISTTEYAAAAPRPAYSVLDGQRLEQTLRRPQRLWLEALADHLCDRGTLPP